MSENLPVVKEAQSLMDLILKQGDTMDPAKISQLMDLHDRALARESKRKFDEDFVRMKPKLPKIIKTHYNQQTNSKYAKLEDINLIIDPIIEPFGFGTACDLIAQTETSVTVEAQLIHNGGWTKKTAVTMPLDNKGPQGTVNKTGPHATKSSIEYAKRTAICLLLNISTGEDKDGNLDTSTITAEQVLEIDQRVNGFEEDYKPKFLDYMKVASIAEIPAKDYKKAKTALDAKKKAFDSAKKQANV